VLIYVASAPGGRATIAEVARAFDVSEHHLVKVVHLLGREGFLVNTRGRGGGLRLAQPAHAINVGRVVRAAEGNGVPAECFEEDAGHCAITRVCRLKGVLGKAVAAFYDVLDGCHLDDLVANRAQLVAVLHRQPRLQ